MQYVRQSLDLRKKVFSDRIDSLNEILVTLPVRKRPAGIQVYLNTWNLKKNTGGFFSPSHEMEYRWKALYSNKMRRNM